MERIYLDSLLLFRRSLMRTLQVPRALLAITLLPIAVLWGLCQLLGGLPQAVQGFPTSDYLTFAAPAISVAGVLPGAILTGTVLQADRRSGILEQLLATPARRSALLFGVMLAAVTGAILTGLMVVLGSMICGLRVNAGVTGVLAIVLLSAVVSSLYTALALMLAIVVHSRTTLAALCGSLIAGSVLMSDLLLPATLLPNWLTALSTINPLSYAIEGARTFVGERTSWQTYGHDLLILTCLALLSGGLALSTFHWYIEGQV